MAALCVELVALTAVRDVSMLNGFQSHERSWMAESIFPVEITEACFAYAREAKSFRLTILSRIITLLCTA